VKSPAAAHEKVWKSSSKVDKVVEVLDAIRKGNERDASTAAGSAAAAAAASALRAAPLAARSKSENRMLAAMRRGRSPGLGPSPGSSSGGGSNAPAAGGSSVAAAGSSGGGAAAAASNAAAVRPEKAIVFSQWTSMLDLLEVPLKKAGFVFRRLDGTMSVAAREKAIADFETCPEVRGGAFIRACGRVLHPRLGVLGGGLPKRWCIALEVQLNKALGCVDVGFVFRRLDGTMRVAAREKAIADFETCPEVRVLRGERRGVSQGTTWAPPGEVLSPHSVGHAFVSFAFITC
jgi:hypothetical protein